MIKRDKLGRFVKGTPQPYGFKKGHKLSEESEMKRRKNISKSLKGNIIKKETREKISKANKNPSKETRNKMSNAKKELFKDKTKHPMYGKENKWGNHTEENIEKMRESKLGDLNPTKRPEVREKMKKNHKGMSGKHHSRKTRKKLGLLKLGDKNPTKRPEVQEKIRKARLNQILPIKDTSIEVKIQSFLKKLGIEFVTHFYIKEIEHKYRCDIFIPSIKLIIECDGDYWHANPQFYSEEILNEKQKWKRRMDELRTKELIEKGFRILRLWGSEIKEISLGNFKEKIKRFK